ncbi:MAG: chemotaxis protein CheD [candidate division Zixibacteria bacterium]|nr:chemotaxis protein CheD [candidate division Zixibacteria bacterium]
MASKIVGISDIYISNKPDDVIITYSLGSCIGVTMYDAEAQVGGMIHYMLPLSKIAPEKAKAKPGMFADTGMTTMLKKIYSMGASKNRLIVKVAGGAKLLDQNKVFNIGERNFLILRKLMWKNNILIKSKDVGGSKSRTLKLEMETGRVTIKSSGEEVEL